eukprot:COSAG02_NODE_57020_length_282_cov_1.120219_2_plen_27_part_01
MSVWVYWVRMEQGRPRRESSMLLPLAH